MALAAEGEGRRLISGKRLRCNILDLDRYGRLVAQCFLRGDIMAPASN